MKKILFCLVSFFCSTSFADTDPILVGKWKGTYYGCGQGVPTNAEIDVYDNLNAVFRFYASNSSFGAFDGLFHGAIQRNKTSIVFKPIDNGIAAWFIRPSGSWVSIGFSATLDEKNLSMAGNVTSTASCTKIELTKVSPNNCEAVYESNNLHIPCVKVKVPFDNDLNYDVDMQYQLLSNPMSFQLSGAKPK